MGRRQRRHPALEIAVFMAALLLAVFIARELWDRRAAVRPAEPETASAEPVALNPTRPPLPAGLSSSRTERAVSGVPPIRLTRVQRRRSKPDAVPAPR